MYIYIFDNKNNIINDTGINQPEMSFLKPVQYWKVLLLDFNWKKNNTFHDVCPNYYILVFIIVYPVKITVYLDPNELVFWFR